MTLDEMLCFTNRKDSYGIDFVVNYKDIKEKGDSLQLDTTGKPHFSKKDMNRKKVHYKNLIDDDLL